MGNQQCQQCQQNTPENQAYGAYEISRRGTDKNNNKVYAVVEKKVQKDPILQQKVLEQLQTRKFIKNAHIASLHNYNIITTNYGFCVHMYYQYIPKTLKQRIEDLKIQGKHFSERELFAIIYGIQEALRVLYDNNIKHCCINLDTILCKNNLLYKLTDVSSTTYITSYDLVSKGDTQQFLSQKLLDNFSHKSLAPDYQLADDLFSLGMIVLMIAADKSVSDFYFWGDKNSCCLNVTNINLSFKLVARNYSSKLIKKIKSLLFEGTKITKNTSTQVSSTIINGSDIAQKSDQANISESLQELEEEMSRVLGRVKKLNSTLGQSEKKSEQYDYYE